MPDESLFIITIQISDFFNMKFFWCNYSETKAFCIAPRSHAFCNPRKHTETKTAMHEWPLLDQVIFDDDSQTATKEQIVVHNVGFNPFRLRFEFLIFWIERMWEKLDQVLVIHAWKSSLSFVFLDCKHQNAWDLAWVHCRRLLFQSNWTKRVSFLFLRSSFSSYLFSQWDFFLRKLQFQ